MVLSARVMYISKYASSVVKSAVCAAVRATENLPLLLFTIPLLVVSSTMTSAEFLSVRNWIFAVQLVVVSGFPLVLYLV